MMIRKSAIWFFLPASLAIGAERLSAQDHPDVERGFNASSLYDFGNLDAVNLFNGNLTLSLPVGQSYPVDGGLSYRLTLQYNSNVWALQHRPDSVKRVVPEPYHNAGLGFRVSFGELYRPGQALSPEDPDGWLLVEGDGSKHEFLTKLHIQDPDDDLFYTKDGSYLRLRAIASGEAEVESPNGLKRVFRSDGRIRRIVDRFGNYLDVRYPDAATWLLTDKHGRTHSVHLRLDAPHGIPQIARIELAAFGGARAVYGFVYDDAEIDRNVRDNDPQTPNRLVVPLLARLTLPDGSFYAMTYYKANAYQHPDPSDPRVVEPSGLLRSLRLPTGGGLEWRYAVYRLGGDPVTLTAGVRRKRLVTQVGQLHGDWIYDQEKDALPLSQESRTTVTNPAGDQTIHYFSNHTRDEESWRYGLPFTTRVVDGDRFLSQRTYDGPVSGGQLKRSLFVRFTADYGARVRRGNQRLVSQRVVYHDDGGRTADTTSSDFDGLGHYRTVTTGGSFGVRDVRQTTTFFNPDQGTYSFDAESNAFGPDHSFQMLPAWRPWILDTFTRSAESEAGATAATLHCYDTVRGVLLRRRVLAGSDPGPTDVVHVFQYDANGNRSSERAYGGDAAGLSASANLCALPLPVDQHRIDHTYQFGSLQTSQLVSVSGAPLEFRSVDRDIDAGTGFVAADRDRSGLATTFEYDAMARLIWARPARGHDGLMQIEYAPATGGNAAYVRILHRGNPSSTSILAHRILRYDSFGRLWREQTLMPSGQWATTETLYNALGWRTSVSETEYGTPVHRTQFLSHDPFGRPTKIRPPDGASHDVDILYQGSRYVRRTTRVGVATGSEAAVEVREFYDRQGRLERVEEPSGAVGERVHTIYGYDVAGRLARVSTSALVDGRSTTQRRFYTYDRRGFLLWEQHPEKGANGNGKVYFSGYDARGNPTRKIDGASDLTLTYDRANRLLTVRETGGQRRLLKTFEYATANAGGEFALGKLRKATRFNHLQPRFNLTVAVTESFTYAGRGGRVSQKVTETDTANRERFVQAFGYDPLGHLDSLDYPRCTQPTCTDDAPVADRTVRFEYRHGLLTSVPGYVPTLSYHANGTLQHVHHANGVVDTMEADPHGTRRPARISTSGAEIDWNSGLYRYDGTGNVTGIGADQLVYDRVSRLKEATAVSAGTARQSYEYDPFGNVRAIVTERNGQATRRTIAVASETNRLAGVAYDTAGNQTTWGPFRYTYDAFNQLALLQGQGNDWVFLYTADDERVWSYNAARGASYWTLRDLEGKVLRWFLSEGQSGTVAWFHFKDYVYAGRRLVASYNWGSAPGGKWFWHYSLDHLGSPRLITDDGRRVAGRHAYFGFGEEATAFPNDHEPIRFAGQIRDFNADLDDAFDDLDYLHARVYNPQLARFLQPDPVDSARTRLPQSWNKYAYALNNPVRLVDPDGGTARDVFWAVVDFGSGVQNAILSDMLFGLGRVDPFSRSFEIGQKTGDVLSLLGGATETVSGLSVGTSGGACLVGTGGACTPAAVPAMAAGAVLTVHGGGTALTAGRNLFEPMTMAGEGGGFGDLRKLTKGEIKEWKKLGIDPEDLKADLLGRDAAARFNIHVGTDGRVYFVSIRGDDVIDSGFFLDDLISMSGKR